MKRDKQYFLGHKPVPGSIGELIEKIAKPQSFMDYLFRGSRLNQYIRKNYPQKKTDTGKNCKKR